MPQLTREQLQQRVKSDLAEMEAFWTNRRAKQKATAPLSQPDASVVKNLLPVKPSSAPGRPRQWSWSQSIAKRYGPSLWARLHSWSAGADLAEAEHWLNAFDMAVPCGQCREHWRKMRRERQPDKSSNKALSRWVWEMHNRVNREKDEPSPEITWNECCDIHRYPAEWKDGG